MESKTSRLLINLRIISKISVNGRLNTYDNNLSLYDGTWYQWFMRHYKFDSKERTKHTLELFYKDVITKMEDLIESENNILLKHLNKQMKESIKGIVMLKDTTYKDNAGMTSFLDSLIEDTISPQINKVDKILCKTKSIIIPYKQPEKNIKINHSYPPGKK